MKVIEGQRFRNTLICNKTFRDVYRALEQYSNAYNAKLYSRGVSLFSCCSSTLAVLELNLVHLVLDLRTCLLKIACMQQAISLEEPANGKQ
jgi:hypothetical protein